MSAAFLIQVTGRDGELFVGEYLQGPRDPAAVRRNGYGFTKEAGQAWPFESRKEAERKVRVVARHFQKSEHQLEVVESEPRHE